MTSFLNRVRNLPRLGVGVSTEYGARSELTLDPLELRREHPRFASFLEIGVEIEKGLDDSALAWIADGGKTTYHFLDLNLDEPEDFSPLWLFEVQRIVNLLRPAWLCGDAGLWHFGGREPGQMLLLPPVLTDDAASQFAAGISRLRDAIGLEVIPENPPGTAFAGDLSLLDFYRRVCERADTGLLLDCAHLAIYGQATGRDVLADLESFPIERIVELHVAGGEARDVDGLTVIDDSHGCDPLPSTWAIFEEVLASASNLKAIVFECERNPIQGALAGFERIERSWRAHEAKARREERS